MNVTEEVVWIKFLSHRSRERGLGLLDRNGIMPAAYWSPKRPKAYFGIYPVPLDGLGLLKMGQMYGVRFTRLRGPYDDLMGCWG